MPCPGSRTRKDRSVRGSCPTCPRGIITVSRTIDGIVVTEFGKVGVKGKNTWRRAGLMNIAHPDTRKS